MSFLIIGVDPGESAGVACIRDDTLVYAGQMEPAQALDMVELLIMRYPDDDKIIACETFIQRPGVALSHQPTAQRMIGMVTQLAADEGVRVLMQMPADAKAMITNELLRKLGMWQTRDSVGRPDANDANSAVRHALLCMARTRAATFDRLIDRLVG